MDHEVVVMCKVGVVVMCKVGVVVMCKVGVVVNEQARGWRSRLLEN